MNGNILALTEGNLTFCFPDTHATQYDSWSFYRNQFNKAFGGTKAVDFIWVQERVAWLIEVKDYSQHRRTKDQKLWNEIAFKVRDTLAGLASAKWNSNDPEEKEFARSVLNCRKIRVVLHLEQPRTHSKLFPRCFNPATVQIKLRQLLRPLDPHVIVTNRNQANPNIPWQVTRN